MYQRTSIVAGKENVKQFQIRGLHIKADSDKTDDFTIDYNSSTKNCRILQQWCGSNFNSNKMYIVDANEYKKTNTYTCNYDEENGKFTFQVFYYYYTSGAYKYGAIVISKCYNGFMALHFLEKKRYRSTLCS